MPRVNFSRTKSKAFFSSIHLTYKLTWNYFSFFFLLNALSTERLIKKLSTFLHTSKIANIMITDEAYAGAYLREALCNAPPPLLDSVF